MKRKNRSQFEKLQPAYSILEKCEGLPFQGLWTEYLYDYDDLGGIFSGT